MNVIRIEYLLYFQAATALMLCGMIWTIQIVHYPLFAMVGEESFKAYEAQHQQLISIVVIPLMLFELLVAIYLVLGGATPTGLRTASWIGLALVALIWVSTFLLSVPAHNQLMTGFSATAHTSLVQTNWIRTLAWSIRGGLALWMIHRVHTLSV